MTLFYISIEKIHFTIVETRYFLEHYENMWIMIIHLRILCTFHFRESIFQGKDEYVLRPENVINIYYFILSGRISRNIGENIFRSYTGTTCENTDFHVLVS